METTVTPLERFLDAIERRDSEALGDAVASSAAWHIPGRNDIAGFHKGREEIVGLVERIGRMTNESFTVEPHDLVANERHAVLLGHVTATKRGERLSIHAVATFHISDGTLMDMWLAVSDQYAFDAFFT